VVHVIAAVVAAGVAVTPEITGGVASGAVVENDNGADGSGGETVLLFAVSAELTR
jgi:hypothetical protein